ncbi:MAG: DNA polymerase III subunit delta [Synechococcaceae cyanobacterium SM2_3_2]|nr:DNA polymerase III subunit delta [Synechococcaceae cyanobacterium SM2_3_2]
MPVYFYWGEDSYRLEAAVNRLRDRVVDPDWIGFNLDRLAADQTLTGFTQAMTPPFGLGERLVWLENTSLVQSCPDETFQDLERTLKQLPDNSHLLLTSSNKPDGRLKSTKLIKQMAEVQEFNLLAPWDADGILNQVKAEVKRQQLKLDPEAVELLATAVGNDSRRLVMELEKLSLLTGVGCGEGDPQAVISAQSIRDLVPASAYNSFQLAGSLKNGKLDVALTVLTHLLDHNEPALKIVAVLVGQFRTWLWIKLLEDQRERDPKVIAQTADIGNPKRIYFLQKEVKGIPASAFLTSLKNLLDLEVSLKRGQPERETFTIALIQIVTAFAPATPAPKAYP